MIKEAIKFLTELGVKPNERIIDVSDSFGNMRTFTIDSEGRRNEITPIINRSKWALEINTLSGLVDYIKASKEREYQDLYLQVFDEKNVSLKGVLDPEGERETLVVASAILPFFGYEIFHKAEELIVALQSTFTETRDRDLLLKVIGNIKEENVRNTGDTGFSQAVTIQTGITSVDDVQVPNPVALAPYRTFLEVDQPVSDFIFRMKDGPKGAIFEADGGAWRNEAIANVRDYLAEQLADEIESGKITIIA